MGLIISVLIPLTLTLGIFTDATYWFKWIVSYICIEVSRKSTKKRFDLYDDFAQNDPLKVDFISNPKEIVIESPSKESDLYTKADEVFFYGVNSKSEYLTIGIERGCNNEAEALICMKLSNGKVYQLKETFGYQQSCSDKKVFTCGGLQLHYVVPMRRWRIYFNGLLKQTDENDALSEEMVHVKFALMWRASSDVFDFTSDIKPCAVAEGLANAKWRGLKPPLEKLKKILNSYAQAGIITGKISINNCEDEHDIYLFGERIRCLGEMSLVKNAEILHVLGRTHETGAFVHVGEVSIQNVVKNLTFGFVVQPAGELTVVTDKKIDLKNLSEEDSAEHDIEANFNCGDTPYVLKGNLIGKQAHFQKKEDLNGHLTIDAFKFDMNSFKCAGIVLKAAILKPLKRVAPKMQISGTPTAVPLVVNFSGKQCQDSAVTGGKGSSLGKLTELSKEFQNFIVPNGIVVTTSAYQLFITKDACEKIKHLEDVLYGNIEGVVKESCQSVMDEIINSEIPEQLSDAVSICLEKDFPDHRTLKFAVRSSATGEDTEQMSAAGQMETFLGVSEISEILIAVKKCWASQFSHIAVQYKRQNGQVLNSPMAVVIQEMIPCDVAGVLFTCDPLTGNPTSMSITANYGLGESVVSASEEPDTIELKRSFDNKLSINEKLIGAKNRRIILQDGKGTIEEDISEEERKSCCLADDMALRLGHLAIKIEESYRSHRDIEWGFWRNNLYIFQSRPVTSGTGETDFEIEHEMDAPLRVENEYFTVCNVGEVCPGALSTLGADILLKYFRITFHSQNSAGWSLFKPKYFPRGIMSMYNHVMFYCCDLLERMDENKDISDAMLVSLFGRVIEDEELFALTRHRFKKQKNSAIVGMFTFVIIVSRLFGAKSVLKKTVKDYENYRIPVEKYKTSKELFSALLLCCTDLCKAMTAHMRNTEASSIWNMFVFNILRKARGEINSEVYRDFAQLLTTSKEVESADVPAGMESLAFHIAEEIQPEEFKKMNVKDAVNWLEGSQTVSGLKYKKFLARHGHRCLKEFDVRSKTWGSDPTTLIKLLQNLVGSTSKSPVRKSDEDYNKIISDLGLTLDYKTRLLLKFFIPQCRQGVQNREVSKSLLIKATDAWRKGYYHLAKLMVSEGRIPDEDLLYFMNLDEINELLERRSPKILSRANHRRRHHPVMEKYIFSEIMKGFPKPVNMEETAMITNDEYFSMKGIPVSKGVVKAFVRVALTLEEAASLQPGEILLTYSTDIGWSPYFPVLAGVVTELGGLISHGAVVSREYGLPCIAGLHGATRQFQTGDYVLLDGNKGILQKLPKPDNDERTT